MAARIVRHPSSNGVVKSGKIQESQSDAVAEIFEGILKTQEKLRPWLYKFKAGLVEISAEYGFDVASHLIGDDYSTKAPRDDMWCFFEGLSDDRLPKVVFGESVLERMERSYRFREAGHKGLEVFGLPESESIYKPGRLLLINSCDEKLITQSALYRDQLSADEIEASAKNAMDEYGIYEVSDALFVFNPLRPYLKRLKEVVLRLKPEMLPKDFIESRAIGFVGNGGYLEVELPADKQQKSYAIMAKQHGIPESQRLYLKDCMREYHADLISPGQFVRCYDLRVDGLHFRGKLLDHNPQARMGGNL